MNHEAMSQSLKAVVVRVLEDAAFVFSDDLPPDAHPSEADWNPPGVSLTFTGETSGTFRLWADEPLLRVLSANMLGLEPGSGNAAEKGSDALRETANIILGHLLTDHFGTEAVFDLGLPSIADPARAKSDCLDDAGVWLRAEGNTLLAVVEIDGQ